MSWNLQLSGSPRAIKHAIAKQPANVPSYVRAAVNDVADDMISREGNLQPHEGNALNVVGHGHTGGGCQASVGRLEITPFRLEPEPPADQPDPGPDV